MLFTTANNNCRDVAQLQKDLIGNEGFCSLPCCQSRTHAWVCPWGAGSITSLGLTLGAEVFYIRWKEIFNSAKTYMRAQGKREEFVTYLAVQSIPLPEFIFWGRSVVLCGLRWQCWTKLTSRNVPADLHTVHMKMFLHHKITGRDLSSRSKDQKVVQISSFLSPYVYWFFKFSVCSSLWALISSTKRTDS